MIELKGGIFSLYPAITSNLPILQLSVHQLPYRPKGFKGINLSCFVSSLTSHHHHSDTLPPNSHFRHTPPTIALTPAPRSSHVIHKPPLILLHNLLEPSETQPIHLEVHHHTVFHPHHLVLIVPIITNLTCPRRL